MNDPKPSKMSVLFQKGPGVPRYQNVSNQHTHNSFISNLFSRLIDLIEKKLSQKWKSFFYFIKYFGSKEKF